MIIPNHPRFIDEAKPHDPNIQSEGTHKVSSDKVEFQDNEDMDAFNAQEDHGNGLASDYMDHQ
ncbi:hypothetical protein SESBI_28869 [Sesbania bispinosa]|nr:hypothetical protein SESBI_28869 [Sesbania bispinosa]